MPRKVRQVVGPTDLCGAKGIPSSLHVSKRIAWFLRQPAELGGPSTMKSSR